MNTPVTDEDIEVRLRLHGPLTGIRETDALWELGRIQIFKRVAKYRDGYGHWPLYEGVHFYKRSFDLAESGQRGWAIIFRIVPPTATPFHEWFVGWVPPEREAEAATWIDLLNGQIAARLREDAAQKAMTDDDHVRFMLDGGTRGLIEQLWEAEDAWGFGGALWLRKKGAEFKQGDGVHRLHAESRFYKQWFELPDTGAKGWAIWFQRGPLDPEVHLGNRCLCGWVPPARETEAASWIDFLNAEIQARLRDQAATWAAMTDEERTAASDAHIMRSADYIRALGIPVPEANSADDFMTKLREMSKDGPIDLRSKHPRREGDD